MELLANHNLHWPTEEVLHQKREKAEVTTQMEGKGWKFRITRSRTEWRITMHPASQQPDVVQPNISAWVGQNRQQEINQQHLVTEYGVWGRALDNFRIIWGDRKQKTILNPLQHWRL